MDFCIECELPLDECQCEVEQDEDEVVDTYTFITEHHGFAVIAMSG